MNNESMTAPTQSLSQIEVDLQLAGQLVSSGFFPKAIQTPAQAVAIMYAGKEMGVGPIEALSKINVIQGKISVTPELMLAQCYRKIPGFYAQILETTAKACQVKFQRPGAEPYIHTFTIEDAAAMQLTGKDAWKKQPATMLRWRCFSAGIRVYAPDAIGGAYTQEEMEAVRDEENPKRIRARIKATSQGKEALSRSLAQTPSELEASPLSVEPVINGDTIAEGLGFKEEATVSEAQRIRLKAMTTSAELDYEKHVKNFMALRMGVSTSKDLTPAQYDRVCAWVERIDKMVKAFQTLAINDIESWLHKSLGDIVEEDFPKLIAVWKGLNEKKFQGGTEEAFRSQFPIKEAEQEKLF